MKTRFIAACLTLLVSPPVAEAQEKGTQGTAQELSVSWIREDLEKQRLRVEAEASQERSALTEKYVSALKKKKDAAQREGDFDLVVALQAEIKSVKSGGSCGRVQAQEGKEHAEHLSQGDSADPGEAPQETQNGLCRHCQETRERPGTIHEGRPA